MIWLSFLITISTCSKLVATYTDGTKELLFVLTLWRHGDRSPAQTFPTDPFQEDAWTFGGGGWGQLSPIGMRQHLNLGKKLRSRYVDEYGFLPKKYNFKQIYIRSTDLNRTLISAMSNLLGQYGQDDGRSVADLDYPDVEGWPKGYVPIPVHTVDYDTDHLANQQSYCPFRFQVWELSKSSEEVKNFTSSERVQSLLTKLTNYSGMPVTVDNLWVITYALYIEQIHFNDTLRQKNTWFSDNLYEEADDINNQIQLYQNGIFKNNPNMANGIDVGLLTRKVQGGSILNDVVMRMNLKLSCQGMTMPNCTWINNLRNYVYSVHDTTLYAFFSALLIEEYAIKRPGSYPMYSATILLELYKDSIDQKPYFKMIYHENESSDFKDITMGIQGCPGDSSYCSLDVLRNFANVVKSDEPMEKWCFSDLNTKHAENTTIFIVIILIAFQKLF